MQLGIANATDLKLAASTLHDARFKAEAIVFDPAARTFTLHCWVLETKRKGADTPRHRMGYRLSFANVTDAKVIVKEKVDYYELSTIRFSEQDGKLDLITHYAIEISLAAEQLDGNLLKTGETLPL